MTRPADQVEKVLVVDDNDELRELQELLLKPAYTVETAESGESGLETLDHTIDVVLLDRNMPGLSGTETAITIQESEYTPAVAIVSANLPTLTFLKSRATPTSKSRSSNPI